VSVSERYSLDNITPITAGARGAPRVDKASGQRDYWQRRMAASTAHIDKSLGPLNYWQRRLPRGSLRILYSLPPEKDYTRGGGPGHRPPGVAGGWGWQRDARAQLLALFGRQSREENERFETFDGFKTTGQLVEAIEKQSHLSNVSNIALVTSSNRPLAPALLSGSCLGRPVRGSGDDSQRCHCGSRSIS
jgi:hypothetical protein